jgi:hypothetical protein
MRDGAVLTPLELPRREAPDVDVERVQPRVVAVAAELDLDLELVAGRGLVADGAYRANAWPAQGAIRSASRERAALNRFTSLRAEKLFIGHLAVPRRDRTRNRGGHAPGTERQARGPRVRRLLRLLETLRKAT